MSEQAPAGGLGGELAGFRYPREYIDVCVEEDGALEFYLGSVSSSATNDYEQAKQAMSQAVDTTLAHFDLDPNKWTEHALELRRENNKSLSAQRIRTRGIKESAGEYLHESAFMDMPMEMELDGEGEAVLMIQLTDRHILEIIGKGVYGRDYFYKEEETDPDPTDLPTGVGFERAKDPDDPLYLGYEDWHRMSFRGRITSPVAVTAS